MSYTASPELSSQLRTSRIWVLRPTPSVPSSTIRRPGSPEGTSNGLIQLAGQASVVFVYIMEAMRTPDGAFTPSLLLALALLVVSAGLVTQMKDPEFTQ